MVKHDLHLHRYIRPLVMAFAVFEFAPAVIPQIAPQPIAFADVETSTTEIVKKKRRRLKGKKRRLKRKRKKQVSATRNRERAATKTLAAKSGPQESADEGVGLFTLFFILLLMTAASYGIFIAYKRSHPEMEWDGIRGQEDTGLRPPGKTNVAGDAHFSKAKWRLLGKRPAENHHPAFGEEPGPAADHEPGEEV